MTTPSLLRRLASIIYDTLLCLALLMLSFLLPHILLSAFAHILTPPWLLKAHFFLILLIYFVGFWLHGGQTLAMKTWRIRLINNSGSTTEERLRPGQALLRYLAACFSLLFFGIGLLWALIDRDGQFLHDRIAGTKLILAQNNN